MANEKKSSNGIQIKLSPHFQAIIFIVGIIFAAGMIYLRVNLSASEGIDMRKNIVILDGRVDKHDIQFGKMEEFKDTTKKYMDTQTKRYDDIMAGIGDIRANIPK